MTKSNFKKSVMTLFQWRHYNCDIEIRHRINVTNFTSSLQSKFLATTDQPKGKPPLFMTFQQKNLTCKNCVRNLGHLQLFLGITRHQLS